MHILVVFTGGTIGSTITGEYISPDEQKAYRLLELYRGMCVQKSGQDICDFTVVQPFQIHSENSTCEKIGKLVREVKMLLSEKEYDGVIVCHGTDTLQYSSSVMGYCFGVQSLPIVFVSSNYVLEDERANGVENFAAAVSFIFGRHGRGVFTAYQNHDGAMQIHRSTRVLPHMPYSDNLVSIKDQYYGVFRGHVYSPDNFQKNSRYEERNDETALLMAENIKEWDSAVLEIYPAVGFAYPDLTAYPDKVKAVLHHTYHSGTICAVTPGLEEFVKQAYGQGILVYLTGQEEGTGYESTKIYTQLGIRVLPKASPIAMYCKLFLCMAAGKNPEEVMFQSLGGDL